MQTPSSRTTRRKSRRYEQFFKVPNEPLVGFSSIAPHHYRSAVKLLQEVEAVCADRQRKICYYVLSAICLFHASLECYLNEYLALSLHLLRDKPADDRVARCLGELQEDTFGREKLTRFLDAYGISEQIDSAVIEDVGCLCDLRNRLYHHSPEMIAFNQYPEAAAVVLKKVGVDAINTSWTSLVSDLKVGAWGKGRH